MASDVPIEELVRKRIEAERLALKEKKADPIKEQVEKRRENEAAKFGLSVGAEKENEISFEFILKCLDRNEVGDGILFAKIHKGCFAFNKTSQRWMKWAGHYWEYDDLDEAYGSVEDVAQILLRSAHDVVTQIDRALQAKDSDQVKRLEGIQKRLYKRVKRLRSETGILKCLKNSHCHRGSSMAVRNKDLDKDPWAFALQNGVLDLRTGDLHPGMPDEWITKASPCDFIGIDAEPVLFKKTLFEIFDGNQDLVDYEQRLFGYCMTGLTRETVLPIKWGKGRNGKTLIVEMISHVFGPMAAPIQSEMLLDQGRSKSASSASPETIALQGLRVAIASEADEGRRFSPAKVKWLSGSDTMVGRSLYDRDPTYFTPSHKLILLTNHKPHAPANDFAFWERVHLIPFTLSFVNRPPQRENERRVDKSLPDKLKEEAPAILSWLVRGCLKWQRDGLSPPKAILAATEEYRKDEDLLADFLDEVCFLDPSARVQASVLYDAFKEWFEKNVSKRGNFSQKKFGNLMKDRFEKVKSSTYFWNGLRLLDS